MQFFQQTSQTPRILEFNTDGETEFHWDGSNRRVLNDAQMKSTSPIDVDDAIGGADWHSLPSEEEAVPNTAQENVEWPASNDAENEAEANQAGWEGQNNDENNWETVRTDQNQDWESGKNDDYQTGQADAFASGEDEIYQTGQNTNWESSPGETNEAWDGVAENGEDTAATENFVGIGQGFETVNTDDEGSAWGSQENFGEGWGESVDWGTAENVASPDNQV